MPKSFTSLKTNLIFGYLFVFLSLVITGCFYFWLNQLPLLIECHLDQQPCPNELESRLINLYQRPLTLNLTQIKRQSFQMYPELTLDLLQFSFPQTLILHFSSKIPLLKLSTPTSTITQALSSDGTFLSTASARVPELHALIEPPDLNPILDLFQQLGHMSLTVSHCTLETLFRLHCVLNSTHHVYFNPYSSDLSRQLTATQLIFKLAPFNPQSFLLDVRFPKPVLKPKDV